jgi:hypothetical protein
MDSTDQPTKTARPRGRPRKHESAEAAAEAKKANDRRRYLRGQALGAPAEFVHYAPVPPGVPSITPSDLGLRISADIPIPCDPLIQPDEDERGEDGIRAPSPLAPLAEDDVEAAEVTNQFQASDREQTRERHDYERRIIQQMDERDARTAEILVELQTGLAVEGRNLQSSSASPVVGERVVEEEFPTANTRSVSHVSTPTVENRINTPAETLNSP